MTSNPGKLVSIGVNDFSAYSYDYRVGLVYRLVLDRLSLDNTYIAIFGPNNTEIYNLLLNDSRIKIIYKAKKAVNRRPGHGFQPRNTLVVWEYSPETAPKEVQ